MTAPRGLAAEVAQARAEVTAMRAELAEATQAVWELLEARKLTTAAVAGLMQDGFTRGYEAARAVPEQEVKRRRAGMRLVPANAPEATATAAPKSRTRRKPGGAA